MTPSELHTRRDGYETTLSISKEGEVLDAKTRLFLEARERQIKIIDKVLAERN